MQALREIQALRGEIATLRKSQAYRMGVVVRYLLRPAEAARALNRRRKRKRQDSTRRNSDHLSGKLATRSAMTVPARRAIETYEMALRTQSFSTDHTKLAFLRFEPRSWDGPE